MLGQVRVRDKSNRIAAVPAPLGMPAPKGNRGTPYEDVKPYPDDPAQDGKRPCRRDIDGGRGRIGTRTAGVIHDIDRLRHRYRRPGSAAVGKVVSARGTGAGTTTETRYCIMSAMFSPRRFRHAVRSRRVIGNPPHWVSDVTMNGGRQRNRSGKGSENLAPPRRAVPNVARIEHGKDSLHGKLKRAGWDNGFLLNPIVA